MAEDTSLLITVLMFLGVLGAVISILWAVYKKRKKSPLNYPLIGCAASLALLLCAMYFAFDSGVNGERMLPDSAGVSDLEGNSDARVEQDFNAIAEIAPEEVTPEKGNVAQSDTSIDDFPFVTFDEIASGNYKNKIVCVEAIVDNVEHTFYRDVYGGSSFDLWYQSEGAYICSKLHHIFDSNITAYPGNEDFKNITNGDVIRYVTLINRDNSFGTAQSRAVKIVGHIDIKALREGFGTSEEVTKAVESPSTTEPEDIPAPYVEPEPEPVAVKANAQTIERALLSEIPQRYQSDSMFFTDVYVNDDNTVEFMIQLDQNSGNKDAALSLTVEYYKTAKRIAEDAGGQMGRYDIMVLNNGSPVGDYVTDDGKTYSVIADGKVTSIDVS